LGESRKKGAPRICPQCGKQFYRQPSHEDRFCSWECYRHWPDHPRSYRHTARTSDEKTCPICGKRFCSSQYMSNDIYCSRACYSKRPRTGTYKPCRHCGTPFYVIPAHVSKTHYCSRRCRLSHKGPSSIERLLQEELDRRNLPYESQYKIGRWSIDIAFPSQWLAIEADGDYWHSLPENQERDRRKDKVLRAHGWQVLRFTETEIQTSAAACIDRIIDHMPTPL
jgi:very-short-patch-repair endonuclease